MTRPSLARPITWTAIHAILWGLAVVALGAIVPRFERLFIDFGVDLPASAVAIIRLSHTLTASLLPALLALVVLLGIDFVVIGSDRDRDSSGAGWWIAGMTAAPALLLLICAAVIGRIWFALHDKLSG